MELDREKRCDCAMVHENKKKVCMILPRHWKAFMGGAQYQAKCIAEGLNATGRYSIYYVAKEVDREYKSDDCTIVQVTGSRYLRRAGLFTDGVELLTILRRIKPDIIYQRVACAYTGIAALYAKYSNCRMVWHIAHDDDVSKKWDIVRHYWDRRLIEYGIRNSDAIVAQTSQQSELLRANYNREVDAVVRNFHPVPTPPIKGKQATTVVWVANLKPWKRPELFVSLAKDLRDLQNVKFVMVGADLSKDKANEIALRQSMAGCDNIEYLGGLGQEEVNQLLDRSDIFVNTSVEEGFANTFIQSWMRKVPVISLSVNPDNIFDDSMLGYFAGDYKTMVSRVRTLIVDRERREEMGNYAREYAIREHSPRNLESLLDVMDPVQALGV